MAKDTIKAIPTTYAHVEFRSRLEARWAVFFDALEVEWEYEPERARMEGVYYAPDFVVMDVPFVLPSRNGTPRTIDTGEVVLEIKPDRKLTAEELEKCAAYVRARYGGLVILRGDPFHCECNHYRYTKDRYEVTRVQWGAVGESVGLYVLWSRKANYAKLHKPWQKHPIMAQQVFESCFLHSVGTAREYAREYKFK